MFEEMKIVHEQSLLCDFTISVGSWNFKAHKVVLSISSDYFKTMFAIKSKEVDDGIVRLIDVDPMAVKAILDFISTRKIFLIDENVYDILIAASRLQVNLVQDICQKFILDRLNVDNCLDTIVVIVSTCLCYITKP